MKINIAENIKRLRHGADLTQDKLAEYLCVAPQTVSKGNAVRHIPTLKCCLHFI